MPAVSVPQQRRPRVPCSAGEGARGAGGHVVRRADCGRSQQTLLLKLYNAFQWKFVCLYLCQTLTVGAEFFHAHSASG